MNITLLGTPKFAIPFFEAVHADPDLTITSLITQPDKPVGRKKTITPPPAKTWAESHNILVHQPTSLKTDALIKTLTNESPDLFIVIAYGKIIPQTILDIPKQGSINVHPSKLPAYRGPSPIQSAIVAGDTETAISIMLLDDQMDHGPILAQEPITVSKTDTPETLKANVETIGAPLLIKTIKNYAAGTITPQEQNHDAATYCHILKREDGKINWNQPAQTIYNQIRGLTPWPGTFTILTDGKRLKIHEASISTKKLKPAQVLIENNTIHIGTITTALKIHTLQPEGKPKMTTEKFTKGHQAIDIGTTNR